ncbi:hypothetical protein PIB30_024636 [Stylosanthes scabra]|uniref:Uncharacterized protein n=1 Tax=Stylosanthes scabra TaxID=79078 RepID=A0ABU6X7D1_9FABA|nr:hypothetical protein [Stylosanthes scabra]
MREVLSDAHAYAWALLPNSLAAHNRDSEMLWSRINVTVHAYAWGDSDALDSRICMVRTRSASLAKGKAKLCLPPTRASPRLAALRLNTAVQIPTSTPDVPVKEAVT